MALSLLDMMPNASRRLRALDTSRVLQSSHRAKGEGSKAVDIQSVRYVDANGRMKPN